MVSKRSGWFRKAGAHEDGEPGQRQTATSDNRANWQLVAASVATGVAGAGFIVIVKRHLGLEAFVPVAQLWSIWSIAAASLLFAYQQWAIKLRLDSWASIRRSLTRRPLAIIGLAGAGTTAVTWLTRTLVFDTNTSFWPVMAGLVVIGTILSGTARGALAVGQSDASLAIVIAGENVIRIVIGIALVVLAAPTWSFGAALVLGFAVIVIVPRTGDPALPKATEAAGSATLGSAAVAGFLSHAALAGPPILAAFNGATSEAISTLFVVLTAVRLPHLLLQAGAPRAGVAFQNWTDIGAFAEQDRARRLIVGGSIAVATAAGAAGALLGNTIVGTVFDVRGQVDAVSYAAVSAAAVLSVGATLATVQLVAEDRHRRVVPSWAVPLATGAALAAVFRASSINDYAIGLLGVHIGVLVLLVSGAAPTRTGGDTRLVSPVRSRLDRP